MKKVQKVTVRVFSRITDIAEAEAARREKQAKEQAMERAIRSAAFLASFDNPSGEPERETGASLPAKPAEKVFREAVEVAMQLETEEDAEAVETVEFTADGTLTDTGDGLQLRYEEAAMTGENKVATFLAFGYDDPQQILMTRSGAGSTTMMFRGDGLRCMGRYDTGVGEVEICIATRRLVNTLRWGEGGKLEMEYILEVRGLQAEYARVSFEVWPQPAEDARGGVTVISDRLHNMASCEKILRQAGDAQAAADRRREETT